jgi:hypothetical protein
MSWRDIGYAVVMAVAGAIAFTTVIDVGRIAVLGTSRQWSVHHTRNKRSSRRFFDLRNAACVCHN